MNQKYKAAQKQQIKQEIYSYIVAYFRDHGYCPSNKEVAEHVMVSTHTVERHILELLEMGLLKTDHPGTPRAYGLANFELRRKRVGK